MWGLQEQLQALTADLLSVLAWQNGGGTKKDYPEQIPRPGVKPKKSITKGDVMAVDEMAAWLGGHFIEAEGL